MTEQSLSRRSALSPDRLVSDLLSPAFNLTPEFEEAFFRGRPVSELGRDVGVLVPSDIPVNLIRQASLSLV